MTNVALNKGHEAKGRAKQALGKATKDRSLAARGKGEQVTAQLKQAAGGVKRGARSGARKVKGTLSR
jgi:uncharacterized protein YjbJ (UPF0337 family)